MVTGIGEKLNKLWQRAYDGTTALANKVQDIDKQGAEMTIRGIPLELKNN